MVHLVLADHDLLNQLAVTELHKVRAVEGTGNFTASYERKAFDALEVRMFDDHDPLLGKK